MDIPRKQQKGRKLIKRILFITVAIVAITTVTLGLSRLQPAAPGVERESLLLDKVKQGDMVLEVRGVGRLMSEDRLVVPALVAGRIKRILIEPGALVEPNTVILELTNPDLQLAWLEAQSNLTSAQARFIAENARQQDRLLELEAGLANTQARLQDARLQAKVDQTQHADGLIACFLATMGTSDSRNTVVRPVRVSQVPRLLCPHAPYPATPGSPSAAYECRFTDGSRLQHMRQHSHSHVA